MTGILNTTRTVMLALAPLLLVLPACHHAEEHHEEPHQIVATQPVEQDVISTQQYVCQIHSRRHIEVRALQNGYLEAIPVKEGQTVKQGELLFKVVPTLYQAKLDAELAEAQLAQIEFNNTKKLLQQNVVSQQELALAEAKLAKTKAQVELARAELNFTEVKAPFDGIIDRLHCQQGSLIEEGDVLTTLSDNDVMWVYFNVPEASYLAYKAELDNKPQSSLQTAQQKAKPDDDDGDDDDDDDDDHEDHDRKDSDHKDSDKTDSNHKDDQERNEGLTLELVLANGKTFPQPGHISAIEADFNNETGNIAFRADFDNPTGLLRHGQTGNILIHRVLHDAIVIPQRATFEILDRRYVYVIGKDDIVQQRQIEVGYAMEDLYVISKGLHKDEKIVLEGIRQVRDGEKVEFELRDAHEVFKALKNAAQ